MLEERQYFVYIMASKRNGTLYIGVTNNLIRRILERKQDLNNGFTKEHRVHRLVWYDVTNDIGSAIEAEKRMKGWKREWKIRLVEDNNPEWNDLYEEVVQG